MKVKTNFTTCLCVSFLLLISVSAVHATIIGSALFDGLSGKFIYSYTVQNTSATATISSWLLEFSITPDWNPLDTNFGGDVTVPVGWSASAFFNPQNQDFSINFLVLGAEVGPGETLSGFSFPSALPPGNVTFSETLFTPPFTLSFNTGTTVGPTPEPGTWLLFSIGLAGLFIFGRIRKRHTG